MMWEFLSEFGNAIIGLFGVIIGGIMVTSRELWSSKVQNRQNGSYAAIRIICILEEYVSDCVDVVGDDGTSQGQPAGRTNDGQSYYLAQVIQPAAPNYPDDIVWQSLDEKHMHRILSLPNLAKDTDRAIAAASEHSFLPDNSEIFPVRQEGYAKLALQAIDIIDDLRKQFSVNTEGILISKNDWNAKEFLTNKVQ